jgi:hypothetical protein
MTKAAQPIMQAKENAQAFSGESLFRAMLPFVFIANLSQPFLRQYPSGFFALFFGAFADDIAGARLESSKSPHIFADDPKEKDRDAANKADDAGVEAQPSTVPPLTAQ